VERLEAVLGAPRALRALLLSYPGKDAMVAFQAEAVGGGDRTVTPKPSRAAKVAGDVLVEVGTGGDETPGPFVGSRRGPGGAARRLAGASERAVASSLARDFSSVIAPKEEAAEEEQVLDIGYLCPRPRVRERIPIEDWHPPTGTQRTRRHGGSAFGRPAQ
jgi:hypothetical protein